jgi:preprotein translocase SecF subunit
MNQDKIIKFYEKRKIFFAISLSIFVIGIIALFINGVQLDIQFKGGAILKYTYSGSIDEYAAGDIVSEVLNRPVTTQLTEDLASEEQRIIFNIAGKSGIDVKDQQEFDRQLKERFPENNIELSEASMVEPFFGRQFLRRGMLSILIAAVLVMLYVWVRFKMMGGLSAGVMALIALFHDVLVVFFTCVIFKVPIGDSFVAVALSIIGYSINDTIVIYDRIRENNKIYVDFDVETITNLSITQSMMRSVMTNVAVIISVTIVYFLAFANGIDSIQSFALPMAVGSVSGCYSTICIAGPLWVMWKKRKKGAALFSK